MPYLRYGSYTHDSNECSIGLRRDGIIQDGQSRGYLETWTITGKLFGTDTSNVASRMATMAAAYIFAAQDIGFYDDSNNLLFGLSTINCLGGTRVRQPPHFSDMRGAQLTTWVDYSITIEGEVFNSFAAILFWQETIAWRGGGPRHVHLEALTGAPQKQLINEQTTYRAFQQGQAVGYMSPISPPPPFAPFDERIDLRELTQGSGRRIGPTGLASYLEFPTSWSYTFESAGPLIGVPARAPQ